MPVVRRISRIDPVYLEGTVIHGFRRGGSLLNCPTANMDTKNIQERITQFQKGVYFGWANLQGNTYKMVANIGKNPSFNNEHTSVEVHLLHEFPEDFYDENLKVLIIGSIRLESKFSSLDELKQAIHEDCAIVEKLLDEKEYQSFSVTEFFN